jgi:hypothetical protein
VVLQRMVRAVIDAKTGGTAKVGKATVQLPGGAMIKSDGALHEGEVVVMVAATDPEKDVEWARDPKDAAPKGWAAPSPTRSGGVHVQLTDSGGAPLLFALGERAQLKVPVPKGAGAQEGKEYELKSVDEKTGARQAESKCKVVKEGDDLLCVGSVDHFSSWIVSFSVRATDLGCAQYTVTLTEAPANVATLFASVGGTAGPKVCALGATGEKPWIAGSWSSTKYSGFRLAVEDALPAGSLSVDDLDGTADCGPDGALKCAQYTVQINPKDYAVDTDEDGAPDVADCNPNDPNIYPGAPRNYCEAVDRDCDGKPDGGNLAELRAKAPLEWNALCPWVKAACASELSEEIDGNAIDEDCDGFVSDQDGDQVYAYGDPKRGTAAADCDDFDANAKPTGTELPNNIVDENCDGIYSDADGDGVLSAKELASRVGADSLDVTKVDCNDFDSEVKPGANVKDATPFASGERGAGFYDGEGKRTDKFCQLFDAMGKLTRYGLSVMRGADRNCNGVLEDLDGDTELVAAGGPFANPPPYDVNDLEPGVTSQGGQEASGASCAAKPDLSNFGGGKYRVCPLLFGLEQACVEAQDQQMQGTGIFVCAAYDYAGFKLAPNPLQPGKQYGPCSEQAACEAEPLLQCGGPVTFAEDYVEQLSRAEGGLDLSEVAFQGLCMPRCDAL